MPLAPVVGGALLAVVGGTVTMVVLIGVAVAVALIPTLSRTVRSVPRPSEWAKDVADEPAATERALA